MPPRNPVTREDFAALVAGLRAEMRGGDRDALLAAWTARPRRRRPVAFTARPWAARRLTLDQAAEATGLAPKSLHDYTGHARRARERGEDDSRTMPAPYRDGTWEAGALAVWIASRRGGKGNRPRYWPSREERLAAARVILEREDGRVSSRALAAELGVSLPLAQELVREVRGSPGERIYPGSGSDEDVAEFTSGFLAAHGRTPSPADLREALARAGLPADDGRVARILAGARAELVPPDAPGEGDDPEEYAPAEPSRADEMLTISELGRAYGVSYWVIRAAMKRGDLTPTGERPWRFDPARVTSRRDGWRCPVDVGNPKAAPRQD